MDFSIRTVGEQDAQGIIELLNPIIAEGRYTIMEGPITLESQLDYIHSFPERGVFKAAVSNDGQKILGIQDIVPHSAAEDALAHVGEIATFVALDAHRKGVGHRLCQASFQEARNLGFLKIMAMIRGDNPKALSFYRNQGFELIGTARRHSCVQGQFIDEVFMERFLDPTSM